MNKLFTINFAFLPYFSQCLDEEFLGIWSIQCPRIQLDANFAMLCHPTIVELVTKQGNAQKLGPPQMPLPLGYFGHNA
jgi:hypothetical protein